MKTTSATSQQMPLPMGIESKPAHAPTTLEQKLARIRDEIACKTTLIEKSQSRARFLIGEIVLDSPALLALVTPHLEPHLVKLGSARKAIDDYPQTAAELDRLRGLSL
jgi:hypothetical protein